jgi:hypothetical protein
MPIQFATDPSMTGDVRMRVLDNDGLEQQIINEELDSFIEVEWKITGPHFWAYALNDSVWRVRIGVESFGPAREHAFPPAGQPIHTVNARDFDSVDVATQTVSWKTQVRVPDDVYDADVVYKPAAAIDFKVDSAIPALVVQVAGFAEGDIFQTREDPDEPAGN